MDRHAEPDLSICFDNDSLPFFRKIGSLCGNKKGVEMLFHGASIIRAK